jgi:Zn-finger nucleic acid-binding protein
MNCPVCKNPMIILELSSIEIDYCPSCEGIWLDGGELELLLEDSVEKEKLLNSFFIDNNSKEKKLRCPICRKKMDKILVGDNRNITIDKCKSNDGLWFDKGELEQIVGMGSLDKDNKILSLIKEMFGHKLKLNPTGGGK